MNRWTVVLAAALLGSGCFAGYGAAVGPTVDTAGEVGMQLSLRGEFGLPFTDHSAISETVRVDAAPPGLVTPHVTPVVGMDYFHLLEDDDVAFQVGLRARFQFTWAEQFQAWIGAGLSFAVLPELEVYDNDSDEHTLLGFELEGYYTDDSAADVPEGQHAPRRGIFGLSLVWKQVYLDEDPFDDLWD
jgi:hypothetical protein